MPIALWVFFFFVQTAYPVRMRKIFCPAGGDSIVNINNAYVKESNTRVIFHNPNQH